MLVPVSSDKLGLELVLNKQNPHAFIAAIDYMIYTVLLSPPNTFHLPPQSEDATFFIDTMSMVINKEFGFRRQFDNL